MEAVESSGSASLSGSRRDAMRAIVQDAYGSADVLRLAEIDEPAVERGLGGGAAAATTITPAARSTSPGTNTTRPGPWRAW